MNKPVDRHLPLADARRLTQRVHFERDGTVTIASGKVEAAASLAAAIERQSDGQCRVAGYCHLCKESLEHGRRPTNTLATVLEWLLAELERHPDSAELIVNVEVSRP